MTLQTTIRTADSQKDKIAGWAGQPPEVLREVERILVASTEPESDQPLTRESDLLAMNYQRGRRSILADVRRAMQSQQQRQTAAERT